MGGFEAGTLVLVEPPLGYHPSQIGNLTLCSYPGSGQCLMDSLTGAVASKRVTEAFKGSFRMVGNHLLECKGRKELDCDTYKWSRYESRT